MDFSEIQKALDFLNWKMVIACGVLLLGWVQIAKPYIGDLTIKGLKVPTVPLFSLVSAMVLSHFIFDVAGVTHSETVALFHGFCSFVVSSLGYELLSGKFMQLKSKTELKQNGDKK